MKSLTCHRSVDVQQVFLRAQNGSALGDEPQRHCLLHAALLGQVALQHVHLGLPIAVKHLLGRQPVAGGERDGCGNERGEGVDAPIRCTLTDTSSIPWLRKLNEGFWEARTSNMCVEALL